MKGECFRLAAKYCWNRGEGELVHGTVLSGGKRMKHAWVDLDTGHIWEPESQSYIPEDFWERSFCPEDKVSYNPEEAAIMVARTRNFGPWTKEERRSILGEEHSMGGF